MSDRVEYGILEQHVDPEEDRIIGPWHVRDEEHAKGLIEERNRKFPEVVSTLVSRTVSSWEEVI